MRITQGLRMRYTEAQINIYNYADFEENPFNNLGEKIERQFPQFAYNS